MNGAVTEDANIRFVKETRVTVVILSNFQRGFFYKRANSIIRNREKALDIFAVLINYQLPKVKDTHLF